MGSGKDFKLLKNISFSRVGEDTTSLAGQLLILLSFVDNRLQTKLPVAAVSFFLLSCLFALHNGSFCFLPLSPRLVAATFTMMVEVGSILIRESVFFGINWDVDRLFGIDFCFDVCIVSTVLWKATSCHVDVVVCFMYCATATPVII